MNAASSCGSSGEILPVLHGPTGHFLNERTRGTLLQEYYKINARTGIVITENMVEKNTPFAI